jgi:hypothetical protein
VETDRLPQPMVDDFLALDELALPYHHGTPLSNCIYCSA